MRARELAEQTPMVELDTDALVAARLMAQQQLPGLVVRGEGKHPFIVLPGSQVLRFIIPSYVQDNPALARVFDEKAADKIAESLAGRTVRDVLPGHQDITTVPKVNHDDTLIEVAAIMAQCHSPIVVVVNGSEVIGTITIRRLLRVLFSDESPE